MRGTPGPDPSSPLPDTFTPATRRGFLATVGAGSLAAGSLFAVPNIVRAENRAEKLRLAVIGCGGRSR